jgi:hypothetical protein
MSNKQYYVYGYCDPRIEEYDDIFFNKPFYIGKGLDERLHDHEREYENVKEYLDSNEYKKFNEYKIRYLKELEDLGLTPVIIKVCENIEDEELAYDLESELIKKYGRIDLDENGILTNRLTDQRVRAKGKKGMKHIKPRSLKHREELRKNREGKTLEETMHGNTFKAAEIRIKMTRDRKGKKQSEEHTAKIKSALAAMGGGPAALEWTIITPSGGKFEVKGLRKWCRANGFNYSTVRGSKKGFTAIRHGVAKGGPGKGSDVPSFIRALPIKVLGHILIRDFDTGKVLVDKYNSIHEENMSITIAMGLAGDPEGVIQDMDFGNGGTTVSGTGVITYFPPNVTGPTANLYNETYYQVVNSNSPLNSNPAQNNIQTSHVTGTNYTDMIITCTLGYDEPAGQPAFDNSDTTNNTYTFNELGLRAFNLTPDAGLLLTHVIFNPIQKSLNRQIQIVYTLRIFLN